MKTTPGPAPEPAKHRTLRRFDPDRRQRILEAALETIAEHGVAETTMRRVAVAADVPLGSMTYHFSGRDELLREAFAGFAHDMAERFEAQLAEARDPVQAKKMLVEHICGEGWATRRYLLLCYELYAFSSRAPDSKAILVNWLERVRAALQQHFDKRTADALDALIEGYSIHRSVDRDPPTKADVAAVVEKIVG